MTLRITEREAGAVTVLDLHGHLTMGGEALKLKRRVQELAAKSRTHVVVVVDQIAFLDSFGVGELVAALTSLKKLGGGLKLVCPSDFVKDALRVTHLDTVIPCFESEADAIGSFHVEETTQDESASEPGRQDQ